MERMQLTDAKSPFEFTPEQVQLLRTRAGEPMHVSVKEMNKVYWVVEQGMIPALDEEYFRRGLNKAAESIARGDVQDWDSNEINESGREFLAQRQQQQ
ncbi:MAG TPA: hypothetical protein VH107_00805 [Lacipirellulaceae bacterium]|jgi:hypothetical protein|nr:hypothetical protein [Lacipirellulaceae bacterium]